MFLSVIFNYLLIILNISISWNLETLFICPQILINLMHIYLPETMHILIITIINNQDIDILLYHPGTIILYKLINFHQTRKFTMKLTNLVLLYLISAVKGQKTGEFVALIF